MNGFVPFSRSILSILSLAEETNGDIRSKEMISWSICHSITSLALADDEARSWSEDSLHDDPTTAFPKYQAG